MNSKLTENQKNVIKQYGHLFVNTGGNDIIELLDRQGVTYFNNLIAATLQSCCACQLALIEKLIAEGLIK